MLSTTRSLSRHVLWVCALCAVCLLVALIVLRHQQRQQQSQHRVWRPGLLPEVRFPLRATRLPRRVPRRGGALRAVSEPRRPRRAARAAAPGVRVVGFTHYQEWPMPIPNPPEDPYHRQHPFDNAAPATRVPRPRPRRRRTAAPPPAGVGRVGPGRHRDKRRPRASRRPHRRALAPRGRGAPRAGHVYCLPPEAGADGCAEGWQAWCRNWPLARAAVPRLCAAGCASSPSTTPPRARWRATRAACPRLHGAFLRLLRGALPARRRARSDARRVC